MQQQNANPPGRPVIGTPDVSCYQTPRHGNLETSPLMTTALKIDGKATAAKLTEKVSELTSTLIQEHGITPGLAVVLVGEDPAQPGLCPVQGQIC